MIPECYASSSVTANTGNIRGRVLPYNKDWIGLEGTVYPTRILQMHFPGPISQRVLPPGEYDRTATSRAKNLTELCATINATYSRQ